MCDAPHDRVPHPTAAGFFERLFWDALDGKPGLAPGLARVALRGASLLFRIAVAGRAAAFRSGIFHSTFLPAPVVSIGNITAGGTGKTPAAIFVSRRLQAMGRSPAVLSRGYGAPASGGGTDEETELGRAVPVFTDPDRIRGGRRAIAAGHDVLVLDDGFQHRRLKRDLDIVLIDALDPFGRGHLLPAGLLREPPHALRRAHAVVLSRADLISEPERQRIERDLLRRGAPGGVLSAGHVPDALEGGLQGDPDQLNDRPVFLFCGLGNPGGFTRTVALLGARVTGTKAFRDHHPYTAPDLAAVAQAASSLSCEAVVTTVKDHVKASDLWTSTVPLAALRVRFSLLGGDDRLDPLLRGALARGDARRRPR